MEPVDLVETVCSDKMVLLCLMVVSILHPVDEGEKGSDSAYLFLQSTGLD